MAFDLDDEELKATRKLNGSDKNVGSMEENIKILERMLNKESKIYKTNKRGNKEIKFEVNSNYYKAIENLIKAYKELEEENKIIKGNYYTLCVDIQMVTSELGFPGDTIIADEMIPMIKENYIPVSLVEEKMEEVNKEDENLMYKNNIIKVLQELLEKRK